MTSDPGPREPGRGQGVHSTLPVTVMRGRPLPADEVALSAFVSLPTPAQPCPLPDSRSASLLRNHLVHRAAEVDHIQLAEVVLAKAHDLVFGVGQLPVLDPAG